MRVAIKLALLELKNFGEDFECDILIAFSLASSGVVVPKYAISQGELEFTVQITKGSYSNLKVEDGYFELTLMFSSDREARVKVPYHSISRYADRLADVMIEIDPEIKGFSDLKN